MGLGNQKKKKKKKWLFFLLFFVWVNTKWKKEMVAGLESTSLSPTPKIYPVNDTPSSGAGMSHLRAPVRVSQEHPGLAT